MGIFGGVDRTRPHGSQLARADGRKPRRCMRKPLDEARKVYSLARKRPRDPRMGKGLADWAMDGGGASGAARTAGPRRSGFGPVEAVMAPSLPLVQNALRRW